MSLLLSVDSQITDFINHIIPHTTVFNTLFSFLSLKGDSIVIWLLLLLITVIFNKKMNYKFIFLFFLVFLTTMFINDILLKNIFQRARPIVSSSSCPLNFSFPSGHSACAFALAYVFSSFDKKRKCFYYLISVLIAFSRIYLYCHFISDVVIGAIIGLIIAKIILSLLKKGLKK